MSLLDDSYISFVNLDHRIDRKEKLLEEFKRVGLDKYPIERTKGMYPTEFDLTNPIYQKMVNRTVGAIGCMESQLRIMRKALELNKHALVLEDDLIFASDFLKRMDYINQWQYRGWNLEGHMWVTTAPVRKFDVIWLGGTFHVGGNRGPYWHTQLLGRDVELTDDPRMLKSFGSFSTHAYLVHRDSLKRVIDLLEQFMPQSIGIDYSFIQLTPFNLNNYVFVPGCVKQYDNVSDQVPGQNHMTLFSKFAALNGTIENSRYWWQDKMEDFNPETFDWAEARVR